MSIDTPPSGYFVVLDGQDGTGKTTQIPLLKARLEADGYEVVTTREPGGSAGAEEVRTLLVTGEPGRWDGMSELLLFAAARRNHVETLIKPALADGKIVLCDRFVPSTIAYQGFGRQLSLIDIATITKLAIGDFEPDLTLILFIDAEIGLRRANARRGLETRFEAENQAFFHRVIEGYTHTLLYAKNGVAITLPNETSLSVGESILEVTDQLYQTIIQNLYTTPRRLANRP